VPVLLFLIGLPIALGAGLALLKSSSDSAPSGATNERKLKDGVTLHNAPVSNDVSLGMLSFARSQDVLTPIESFRSIVAPPSADEPMPLQRWSNGSPKIMAREWSDRGVAIEEHCFFSPSGESVGCGVLRDGERWEGIFPQWAAPSGKLDDEATVLREIVSYREGLKDGVARAYFLDGKPMLETLFSQGRQVSKRVFRQTDNEILEMGSRRQTGIPISRRTRNTQD
jgi:hypothetical protein